MRCKHKIKYLKEMFSIKVKGFSLIEVLVAMAVITIGIFAIMTMIMAVIKANAHSRNATTATALVQQKMEDIITLDYGSITTSNTNDLGGTYTTTTAFNVDFNLSISITEDTPVTNSKTIVVGGYWSPATTTSSHKVELSSIVAQ